MIISARIVKPRKIRRCENCGGMIVTEAMRLYGAAEYGDPPYVVWEHVECAARCSNTKIQKAFEQSRTAGREEKRE